MKLVASRNLKLTRIHQQMSSSSSSLAASIQSLLDGKEPFLVIQKVGECRSSSQGASYERSTILSGSFNPIHDGHLQLLELSQGLTQTSQCAFEISVVNVDKPPLSLEEVLKRAKQFTNKHDLLLSTAPRFIEKARLFPRSHFVIGFDTLIRLVDAKYYGGQQEAVDSCFDEFRSLGTRFVVGGRKVGDEFKTFDSLDTIPPHYRDLFIPLPGFRVDTSSTDIRKAQLAAEALQANQSNL